MCSFLIDFAGYAMLLLLHSYVLLAPYELATLHWTEWLLLSWFIALLFEELREACHCI